MNCPKCYEPEAVCTCPPELPTMGAPVAGVELEARLKRLEARVSEMERWLNTRLDNEAAQLQLRHD